MLKTLSFAAMHMTVAFTVVFLMTGDAWAGGAVALIEPLCNTVAFHFHEKLWNGAGPAWLRDLLQAFTHRHASHS